MITIFRRLGLQYGWQEESVGRFSDMLRILRGVRPLVVIPKRR